MDRALVVGLGFIAANLAKRLASRGYEVHATYRNLGGSKALMAEDLREAGVELHPLDPNDRRAVASLLEALRPRYVFNAVGAIKGPREAIWAANAEVPRKIAEAILSVDKGIKLVHLSASAASGPVGRYVREEAVHCGEGYVRPSDDYERSKCEGERAISSLGGLGLRYAIVRPALVYGYYNDHDEFALLYDALRRGIAPIIKGRVSAIYVGYLARLMEELAEGERFDGSFIYAAECADYELGGIVREMAARMGARAIELPIPRALAALALRGGAGGLLKYIDVKYDCGSATRILGDLEPGLGKGISEIVEWISRARGRRRY